MPVPRTAKIGLEHAYPKGSVFLFRRNSPLSQEGKPEQLRKAVFVQWTMKNGRSVVKPIDPTEEQFRLLLVLYRCPVPFHVVRTRFLGLIASPDLHISPIDAMKSLWDRDLPEFKSEAAAIVMDLWDRLARHQERRIPFRLMRVDVPVDREGVRRLALIRREELEGFVSGLLGSRETLELPDRARHALELLSEIRAFLCTVQGVRVDVLKHPTPSDITNMMLRLRTLTGTAEHEIHETVLSCARACRAILRGVSARKPTLH